MHLRRKIAVGLFLGLFASIGCSEQGQPRLDLELRRGADVPMPAHLVVFIKVGEGSKYAVGAQTMDVAQAGYASTAARLVFGVTAPAGVQGPVTIYVAGCQGPPQCSSEFVAAPVCQCDGFSVFAAGKAQVLGYTRLAMDLTPINAAQCDRDGDLFPDCGADGVVSACCDHLESGVRARINDCHETPGASGGDPRTAHPFLPVERRYTTYPTGEALRLHRVYCDDGLDNDCRGEPDVPCMGLDGDGDGADALEDCDDADPGRAPGLPEICGDGIDQDCDNADLPCDLDGDGYDASIDCDDGNPGVNPGAAEICGNGVDDDCRGGDLQCVVEDLDGDGYPCPQQSPQDAHECSGPGLDCDDRNAGAHPGREEICGNAIDENCDGVIEECPMNDRDGDGHVSDRLGGVDCDDADPRVHPGAAERCGNAIDEDCNGVAETCDQINDGDGDGWADDRECDGTRPEAFPGAPELCNGLDDDCDGVADEGNPEAGGLDAVATCGAGCPSEVPCSCRRSVEICGVPSGGRVPEVYCLATLPGAIAEICDGFDQDCDGVADNDPGVAPLLSLQAGVCAGQRQRCGGAAGWLDDPTTVNGYEANETRCDGLDNNCDGAVDRLEGPNSERLQAPCGQSDGECRRGVQYCIDGMISEVCEGSVGPSDEVCNGRDDDCDGRTDERLERPQADLQEGVCRGARQRCERGRWAEPDYRDHARDYERQERSCDGRDNDCDGDVDEDLDPPAADRDRGVCEGLVQQCQGNRGWREPRYQDVDGFEQNESSCDGVDNDCDGSVDEETERACELAGGNCEGVQLCEGGALQMCRPRNGQGRPELCNGDDDDCDGTVDEGDALCPGDEECRSGRCNCPGVPGGDCGGAEVCREGVGCVCAAADRQCGPDETCRPEGCFCERANRVCDGLTVCRGGGMGGCVCPAEGNQRCDDDEVCTQEGCEEND